MRARPLLATVAAALALGAFAGCGEREEPLGELPAAFPVTVRGAADEPMVVGAPPARIVALDRGSAELLIALGAGTRLVGVPADVGGGGEPVVSTIGEIDVERAVALEPDIVVATPETDPVEVSRVGDQAGAAVYLQPSRSVEEIARAALELGSLLGDPVSGRRLAAAIREEVEQVEARLDGVPTIRVFADLGLFVPPAEESLFADLLRRARAELVPRGVPPGTPVDLESIAGAAPAVYVATSDSRQSLAQLRTRPELATVPAVRDGRFVIVPTDTVTTAGPDVARALESLAADLHPDAFR